MKLLFIFFFTLNIVNASYDIIDKENIFIMKIKNSNFKTLYVNLKDEINFQSFTIVHELNLSKSTSFVAEALNKNKILKNGTNILICKSSFTLEMIEENIENISYCPMIISVYEDDKYVYISHKKYKSFNKDEKIAGKINETLKNLILKSLE
jgi:hypothetical protein